MTAQYRYELQVKDEDFSEDEFTTYFVNKTFYSLTELIAAVAQDGEFSEYIDRRTRIKRTPLPEEGETMGDEE